MTSSLRTTESIAEGSTDAFGSKTSTPEVAA